VSIIREFELHPKTNPKLAFDFNKGIGRSMWLESSHIEEVFDIGII